MSRGLLSSGAKRPLLDILRLDPPRFDCAQEIACRIPFPARPAPQITRNSQRATFTCWHYSIRFPFHGIENG